MGFVDFSIFINGFVYIFFSCNEFVTVGGHTAEMINLLNVLQKNSFTPRYYIAAATDNMSLQKAQVLENSWLNEVFCSVLSC